MRTRVVIGALLIGLLVGGRLPAQQPAAPQEQPGLKWTEEQIKKTAHHVRAGRKLTPKTWPNECEKRLNGGGWITATSRRSRTRSTPPCFEPST